MGSDRPRPVTNPPMLIAAIVGRRTDQCPLTVVLFLLVFVQPWRFADAQLDSCWLRSIHVLNALFYLRPWSASGTARDKHSPALGRRLLRERLWPAERLAESVPRLQGRRASACLEVLGTRTRESVHSDDVGATGAGCQGASATGAGGSASKTST